MLKKLFNFILYSLTALTACFASLILVVNFLNPAFSKTPYEIQEKPTFKKIFTDIFNNLKLVLSDLNPSKEEKTEEKPVNQVAEKTPSQPNSFEGDLGSVGDGRNSAQELSGENVSPSGDVPSLPESGNVEALPQEQPPQAGVNQTGTQFPQDKVAGQVGVTSVGQAPVGVQAEAPSQDNQAGLKQMPPQEDLKAPPSPAKLVADDSEDQMPSEVSLEIQSYMAPFIYESSGSRSPFDDPTRNNISSPVDGEIKILIPKTPPEQHNLEEIKLKGIIWNTKNPKALFELPGGAGHYTLIKGDKIGKNGLIFEIREDEVVVVESFYKGEDGESAERVIKIKKMDRLRLNEGAKN